jgi:hypothetical protein
MMRRIDTSSLLLAVECDYFEVVQRAAVECPQNISTARNQLGQNLLHVCARRGHVRLLPLLLPVLDIDAQDLVCLYVIRNTVELPRHTSLVWNLQY